MLRGVTDRASGGNMGYVLPRLKPIVEYCSVGEKIFFFKRPGVAVTMADPSGFIMATCKLMDGKRDLDKLREVLTLSYPTESHYLTDLLHALDKERLLEDVAQNCSGSLTEYDLTRWSRNIDFFSAHSNATGNKYAYQERLKNAKVVILGVGGVGSHVLYNLAALGVYTIRIVDFDTVELSNLNRQILYRESDIGRLKVDAAKKNITEFSNNMQVEYLNKQVSSSLHIEELIAGYDVVIGAADKPRENIIDWLNAACVKFGTPFIVGALDSQWAAYYSVVPGITGCIECWKFSARKSGFIFQDLVQQDGFIAASSQNTTIVSLLSIAVGLVVTEFLKIMTGISAPNAMSRLCAFDFTSAQISVRESWEKNSQCPVCSSSGISERDALCTKP
jgi:molybdopterin-synthase adenylyltransferase